MNINLNDVKMKEDEDGGVVLWSVTGLFYWWPTKIAAEMAARERFPDEDPHSRYARIFYSTFYRP